MTKRDYANAVANGIENAVVEEVNKNGISLLGICRNMNVGVAPIVYIDEAYNNGMSVEEAITMVENTIKANEDTVDMEVVNMIADWNKTKDNVVVRLYGDAMDAEVYEDATNYGFSGLRLVPYVTVDINDGIGGIKVSKSLVNTWGVSERDVIKQGIANIEYTIKTMRDTLIEAMFPDGVDPDDFMTQLMLPPDMNMWVITNKEKVCGASAVIAARKNLKEMFPDGYIVLPSSIHEVIVIPKDIEEKDVLIEMVRNINATQVEPQDRLADNVYEF